MRFFISNLLPLLALLQSASVVTGEIVCDKKRLARRHLGGSDDVEGELSMNTGECKLKCEWGANGEKDRRMLFRGQKLPALKKELLFSNGRRLDIDYVDVAKCDCELTWNGTVYGTSIAFPEGWTQVYKEGDGADDYYGLTTEFVLELGDTGCSVEAELELEFVVKEENDEDVLKYDDSDIAVSC